MKPLPIKRAKKADREYRVLMGLIELYLEQGKPISSNTLRESGFEDLSSATLRNYFAHLEQKGFLHQQHVSGGRIPTALALEAYVSEVVQSEEPSHLHLFEDLKSETKEIIAYLQKAVERLSETTGCATFLSAPRFDRDFVLDARLVPIDASRALCALITDFGSVLTEIIHTDEPIDQEECKRVEAYFAHRLQGADKPKGALANAQKFYNELMIRYITRYSNFTEEEVLRTGFSRLLAYPEFQEPTALANSLSLFESGRKMIALLRSCQQKEDLTYWVGHPTVGSHCSVLTIPYAINGVVVGAVGILGPTRLPYRKLLPILRLFCRQLSSSLSASLHKFRIHYRQPETTLYLEEKQQKLLEDRRS
ncbi:MAG: heat-inducible transcriptional repressor HrcA [Verrucomicrobia bacterium]|nr:heat-inducible transcriptional repressor HrcA [Verrucomicrobiota bacterium]